MKFYRVEELVVFFKEVLVIGFAMVWNIDEYLFRDAKNQYQQRQLKIQSGQQPAKPQPQEDHTK